MSDVRYQYAGAWRSDTCSVVTGGLDRPELPWSDDYAERVFNCEFPPVPSRDKDLPSIEVFAVLQQVDGAPTAVADFQNLGHTVRIDFLDANGWPELLYYFLDINGRSLFDKGGVLRPGDLFLTNIIAIEYSGEKDRYGNPVKKSELHWTHRNSGGIEVSAMIDDPDNPYNGPASLEVDVSGDGFWEPVATFGDWDRWFLRDRPGVPGCD